MKFTLPILIFSGGSDRIVIFTSRILFGCLFLTLMFSSNPMDSIHTVLATVSMKVTAIIIVKFTAIITAGTINSISDGKLNVPTTYDCCQLYQTDQVHIKPKFIHGVE
jgi:hypothetical protein